MYFTKEYITGADLNLKKHNLGNLKQPLVDDFMYDYDFIDFIKPYYIGISLSYDEDVKKSGVVFPYFLLNLELDKGILNSFYKSLEIMYNISADDCKLVEDEIEGVALIINKKEDDKLLPLAFISESNFITLCEVVLEMCKFDKPEPPRKVVGDEELIKRFNKREREYYEKNPNKDGVLFEEIVREIMIIRSILKYDDIKDITVWQLRDVYTTEDIKEVENKQFMLLSSGKAKKKQKIKSWKKETKLKK